MTFTKGQIFRYIALPAILPRIKELFGSGFSHVAFFIAQIYRAARLLPAYHPYLNPVNIGRFGIYHVISEAAKGLDLKKENSDQILIFFVILLGLLILAGQFIILLLGMLFIGSAQASTGIPIDFFDFFKANQPTDHDVAFALLDLVFGVPDIFNSCVAQAMPCFEKGGENIVSQLPGNNMVPYEAYSDYEREKAVGAYPFPTPFHEALRSIMQLYSIGLLVIAAMLFLYFIIAVIAETAQEGTPFGKRFNKVWAPLRMVVALGLLIPIANGLNSGQYLVLYAAKFGSNFATNGWIIFTDTVVTGTNTLLGERSELVVTPQTPQIGNMVEFFTVLATCMRAEAVVNQQLVEAWHVKPNTGAGVTYEPALSGSDFASALDFYENRDIKIVFGTHQLRGDDEPIGAYWQGGIDPVCGEIILPVPSINQTDSPGAWLVTQQLYENFLTPIWAEANNDFTLDDPLDPRDEATLVLISHIGSNMVLKSIIGANKPEFTDIAPEDADYPTTSFLQAVIDAYTSGGGFGPGTSSISIEQIIANGVAETISDGNWLYDLNSLGWGGAGIWYNKLAQLNGALVAAAHKMPIVKEYPALMKEVEDDRQQNNATVTGYDRFKPYLAEEQDIEGRQEGDLGMQTAMYRGQRIWEDVYTVSTTNFLIDGIISVFGLEGLFNMVENADVHPLAQLVGIGKSLVESSIRNLGMAFVGVALGGMPIIGPIISVAGSFLSSIAMIGLGVGFVLFYIIPFLPFIYFFFAVGGWVKGIFEAMVGVPLWALAHIRIDGNGLPGDAAMGGYYLILEIFLRPILIIFGLLASITIFSAQVKILNEIWPLVTTNLTGFDNKTAAGVGKNLTGAVEYMRGHVDRLFFTVIYAIIVYLLAVASFKLVTLIPNNIMRWMGANVQTFGDQSDDPTQNLVRNTMLGSQIVSGSMGQSFGRLRGAMSAPSGGG